jgi:hypothetical protein
VARVGVLLEAPVWAFGSEVWVVGGLVVTSHVGRLLARLVAVEAPDALRTIFRALTDAPSETLAHHLEY